MTATYNFMRVVKLETIHRNLLKTPSTDTNIALTFTIIFLNYTLASMNHTIQTMIGQPI